MLPNQPHNPSRRRLAKGAFASPVVLASLTAKDALAGNKIITCSGNQSVTHASHQAGNTTCDRGQSYGDWCRHYHAGNQGKLPEFLRGCYGKGSDTSARRSSKKKDNTWKELTCHQLLVGRDADPYINDVQFMVKTLCVYLNASQGNYYISDKDVEKLYVAATSGRSFFRESSSSQSFMRTAASTESSQEWDAQDSRQHIEILFRD